MMFMDAQAQAEELIQLVTQSMHGMAQERAEQVTRGEGALLRYLATEPLQESCGRRWRWALAGCLTP
ncbi:MAG: hypothetical protein LUC39_07000 [Clostridiales bacterium]|nr:hypothetical protein [Clostridiales bacterium]